MQLTAPQIVFGYHGCSQWVAERIYSGLESDLKFTDDEETYHWLGKGIYFWENAVERAAEWAVRFGARNLKKRHPELGEKDFEPTVIGAIIHLGECLNLLDIGGHETLRDVAKQVMPRIESAQLDAFMSQPNWKHTIDSLIINRACSNADGTARFDTVRGCFPEGDALFEGSHILTRTHVQVSVRNPNCIIGYFRPKKLDRVFASCGCPAPLAQPGGI